MRRRDALLRTARDESDDIADQLDRPRAIENAEVAQVSEELYTLNQLSESQRREVEQIDQALKALEAGRYGRCAECGGAIDEDRLHAIPQATLCGGHAANRERDLAQAHVRSTKM
jgi:RNA polymerase-binding transcription factor DksA